MTLEEFEHRENLISIGIETSFLLLGSLDSFGTRAYTTRCSLLSSSNSHIERMRESDFDVVCFAKTVDDLSGKRVTCRPLYLKVWY